MFANVGLYSYLAPALIYGGLTVMLAVFWRGKALGTSLVIASGLTAAWGAIIAGGTLTTYPPVALIHTSELARDAGWLYFLIRLSSLRFDTEFDIEKLWTKRLIAACIVILGTIFILPGVVAKLGLDPSIVSDSRFAGWLILSVSGLLLVEQLFRNASEAERWSLKYLCFGLGGIYAYDFFMYAEALLFRNLDSQLWQARGLVTSLAAPLIAMTLSRNREAQFSLQVSRQVVFHSVTLLGAGLYLIAMAIAGYFIRFLDATWGGVLQVSFIVATGGLLLALLFSGKIRSQARVFLSKHFFSYKYDYREEWLKFTTTLAGLGDNAPEGIIRAMAPLVNSPGGLLWGKSDDNHYRLLSQWQMAAPGNNQLRDELAQWVVESGWVIDLDEYRNSPDLYDGLALPPWLQDREDAWLIIPLMFSEQLLGLLMLRRSENRPTINWEDRDLLKTAGRQAATHLAQYLANQDLVEARQFEAFNRLSAYVIHDLKNILAQQSLMVSNAEKHKGNPAFIDDMIATVNNSVERMTKLMEQMRSGVRGMESDVVELTPLLESTCSELAGNLPTPTLKIQAGELKVRANSERLATVFSHLLKNAQEATANNGSLNITLRDNGDMACIEIKDSGCGMEEEFVRSRLFKPFDSTKGLTGMGIGAFESREFIRSLGGDILVLSAPGEGSCFTVNIPATDNETQTATPDKKEVL
jgi:putative PEP-CTERM system histidine kinase